METLKDKLKDLDKKREDYFQAKEEFSNKEKTAFCFKSEWGYEAHGFRLLRAGAFGDKTEYEDLGFFSYDELQKLKDSLVCFFI